MSKCLLLFDICCDSRGTDFFIFFLAPQSQTPFAKFQPLLVYIFVLVLNVFTCFYIVIKYLQT